MNGVSVTSPVGFTVDTTSSVLAGSGNTATPFSCNDGGGNSGSISFNGGADTCP